MGKERTRERRREERRKEYLLFNHFDLQMTQIMPVHLLATGTHHKVQLNANRRQGNVVPNQAAVPYPSLYYEKTKTNSTAYV